MFFKNRAFQIKMVKDDTSPSYFLPDTEPVYERHDIKQISEAMNEFVVQTSVTVGLVIGGYKILDTVCKIALIAAKAKIK